MHTRRLNWDFFRRCFPSYKKTQRASNRWLKNWLTALMCSTQLAVSCCIVSISFFVDNSSVSAQLYPPLMLKIAHNRPSDPSPFPFARLVNTSLFRAWSEEREDFFLFSPDKPDLSIHATHRNLFPIPFRAELFFFWYSQQLCRYLNPCLIAELSCMLSHYWLIHFKKVPKRYRQLASFVDSKDIVPCATWVKRKIFIFVI